MAGESSTGGSSWGRVSFRDVPPHFLLYGMAPPPWPGAGPTPKAWSYTTDETFGVVWCGG